MRLVNPGRSIIILSVLLGLSFWIIDAVLDYLTFHEGGLFELLIMEVPRHEIYVRSVVLFLFLVFGLVVAKIFSESKQAEREL